MAVAYFVLNMFALSLVVRLYNSFFVGTARGGEGGGGVLTAILLIVVAHSDSRGGGGGTAVVTTAAASRFRLRIWLYKIRARVNSKLTS